MFVEVSNGHPHSKSGVREEILRELLIRWSRRWCLQWQGSPPRQVHLYLAGEGTCQIIQFSEMFCCEVVKCWIMPWITLVVSGEWWLILLPCPFSPQPWPSCWGLLIYWAPGMCHSSGADMAIALELRASEFYIHMHACMLSRFSYIWLFVTLNSSVHEILQARILEWVAISSSRGSSWPKDLTYGFFFLRLLHCRWILYHWATKEALTYICIFRNIYTHIHICEYMYMCVCAYMILLKCMDGKGYLTWSMSHQRLLGCDEISDIKGG